MTVELEARQRGAMLFLDDELLAPGKRVEIAPVESSELHVFTFVDGTTDSGELQLAIDALPADASLLINSEGSYRLTKPLRLITSVGVRGTGSATTISADPFFYGGDLFIVGAIQSTMPHGAALYDDSDFSYAIDGSVSPYTFIKLDGFYQQTQACSQLEIRCAFAVDSTAGTFKVIAACSGSYKTFQNDVAFRLHIDGSDQLRCVIVIGGVQHILTSVTTFATGLGTRHEAAVTYDGSTVRLFVDGVIEDSEAATGTFTVKPWQEWSVGVLLGGGFPSQTAAEDGFVGRIDGFFLASQCTHTSNYTVSWLKPTPAASAGQLVILLCETAREEDDLIKLSVRGNGYGWVQVCRNPALSALQTSDVHISDLEFSASDGNTAIGVMGSLYTRIERCNFSLGSAVRGEANPYLSVLADLTHVGGGRWGYVWNAGIVSSRGTLKSSGCGVPFVLGGSGNYETLYAFDYSHIGCYLNQFAGGIRSLGISDEGLTPGIDPLYGLAFIQFSGYAAKLVVDNLGVDIITSDTTIPILAMSPDNNEGGSTVGRVVINGSMGLIAGATTPPSQVIEFHNPLAIHPIYSDIQNGYGVPISDTSWKVFTPDGPAGYKDMTDADATVTIRTGAAFQYPSTLTLTGNRVLTLGNGNYPQMGDRRKVAAQHAGAFSVTVKNHDSTTLHVFAAATPGMKTFYWNGTDWIKEEL